MCDSTKWRDIPGWLRLVWILAILNFVSFAVVAFVSGGDGLSGKEEAGRYFVASHGHYTEVSQRFYYYSWVHAVSAMALIFFVIFATFWFTRSGSLTKINPPNKSVQTTAMTPPPSTRRGAPLSDL